MIFSFSFEGFLFFVFVGVLQSLTGLRAYHNSCNNGGLCLPVERVACCDLF